MSKSTRLTFLTFVFLAVLLSGCGSASTPVPPTFAPSPIPLPPTFTAEPTATETPSPAPTTTLSEATATLEAISLPFSEVGPYHVGIKRNTAYEDSSRSGRKVAITIWYPAIQPQNSTSSGPIVDAMPDLNNAPYPLVLCQSE